MRSLIRAVAPALLLALALAAVPALAHEGDSRYRSVVRTITPATDGLSAEVIDHDDALLLVNRSRRTVVVLDERGRPFARVLGDGVVQVNRAVPEPSHEEREPHVEDQPRETGAAPRWKTLDRTGRFQWHDDRIKYRASDVPPQVTDQSKETKVEDWRVPIVVGGERGAIAGTLTWAGEPGAGSSFPTGAVVSLVVLALAAVGAVAIVQRRRRRAVAGEDG